MNQPPFPILPLTEARAQLFRLAEEILSGQVDRVLLTHRGQSDDLLVMRASAIAQLERELADLRMRVAPELRPLAGLGTLLVTDAAFLADVAASRAEQTAAANAKLLDVSRDLRYASHERRVARVAEATFNASKATKRLVKPTPRG